MRKQSLYIITGLPYSGKTTLTNEMVSRFNFSTTSVDEFLDKGNYTVEKMTLDDWGTVYNQAYDKLKYLLNNGDSVVFDGASLKKSERERLKSIAESINARYKLVYVKTPRSEIEKRWLDNITAKTRGHLEEISLQKAFDMFEEPTEEEKAIVYSPGMNIADWITKNIGL